MTATLHNEVTLDSIIIKLNNASVLRRDTAIHEAKLALAAYIDAEATRRAIEELEHVTVYELDDELGAWYEPDEGYQITVANRIAELSAAQAKEEE